MENKDIKDLLNQMNQKINFILSAVNGTKEELRKEEVEEIEKENILMLETLENEKEVLYNEIEDFENDVEYEKKHFLIDKIATNFILKEFNKNDFDDEDDFDTTKKFSILNDIDIEYLSKKKTGVLEIINAYFFDIKDDLIKLIEEFINEK